MLLRLAKSTAKSLYMCCCCCCCCCLPLTDPRINHFITSGCSCNVKTKMSNSIVIIIIIIIIIIAIIISRGSSIVGVIIAISTSPIKSHTRKQWSTCGENTRNLRKRCEAATLAANCRRSCCCCCCCCCCSCCCCCCCFALAAPSPTSSSPAAANTQMRSPNPAATLAAVGKHDDDNVSAVSGGSSGCEHDATSLSRPSR